jgi:hypothetical protein
MGEGEDKGGLLQGLKEAGIKLADAFISNIDPNQIKQALKEVDMGAADVLKTFGASRDAIAAIRQNLANAIPDVTALGGDLSEVVSMQQQISESLGKNVVISSDAFKDMYAASKASNQEMSIITKSFKDVGISVYDATKQMGDVVNIARASGVNASAVSGQVLQNMEALNKYNFEGGVQGLAKMAAQATSLRIDMKSSLDFAEKVFDPEGAINMAASMQRLGVAQSDLLDPLRMMDLAQNDPGELQNQIAKMSQQFVQLKKDGTGFEIMPGAKRQMREIEQSMGLPLGQLSKMALASADLDDKMKKIKFPTATEEQKTMIANMAEMKGGQYVVNFTDSKGNAQEKAVSELNPEDIKQLAEASKPKSMEELTKGQLDTSKLMLKQLESISKTLPSAIAGSRIGKDTTEVPRELMGALGKMVKPISSQGITKGINKNTDIALDGITKLLSGAGGMSDVSSSLSKIGGNLKDSFGSTFTEVMTNAKKSTSELGNSQNQVIKLLSTGLGTLGNQMKGMSSTKTQEVKVKDFVIQTLPEDKLVMAGGTNLDGNKSGSGSMSSKMDITIKHEVNVNSTGNINKEQVAELFRSKDFTDKVAEASRMAIHNGGLTGGSSSKQKEMNPHIKTV